MHTRRLFPLVLAALLILTSFASAQFYGHGELDPRFGDAGRVVTRLGGADTAARALAIQPDGRIVTVGETQGASRSFTIARYLPDGTLDESFGQGGFATTSFGGIIGASAWATCVAIQPDGKIVAGGVVASSFTAGRSMVVVRYLPNGALDWSFGNSFVINQPAFEAFAPPVVLTPPIGNPPIIIFPPFFFQRGYIFINGAGEGLAGMRFLEATSLAFQPDGKILVGGVARAGANDGKFVVARLLTYGQFDPTFDTDGVLSAQFPGTIFSHLVGLGLQSNGRIIAAGTVLGSAGQKLGVMRFLPNGNLDPTFGTGGQMTTNPVGTGEFVAKAMTLTPNDDILVAGDAFVGATIDFSLAKVTAQGQPAVVAFPPDSPAPSVEAHVQAMALRSDGSVVLAGTSTTAAGSDFAVAIYSSSNSSGFGLNRSASWQTDFTAGLDQAFGVAVDDDGDLVVAGTTSQTGEPTALAIVRYEDGVLRPELYSPVTGELFGGPKPLLISYYLPETVAPGRLVLNFTAGSSVYALTLQDFVGTAGIHSFILTPGNLLGTPEVVSPAYIHYPPLFIGVHGPNGIPIFIPMIDVRPRDPLPTFSLPEGTFSVQLTYLSTTGASRLSAVKTGVVIDYTGPLTLAFPDLSFSATSPAGATFGPTLFPSPDPGGTITFNPPMGSILPPGDNVITVTRTDSAGNATIQTFHIVVTLPAAFHTQLAKLGGPVPGAGVHPRIAEGAVWRSLGTPTINEAGKVAFVGRWSGTRTIPGGTGLFLDDQLILRVGDVLSPAPAIYVGSLKDPIVAGDALAIGATVVGPGVTPASDSVILRCHLPQPLFAIVAREGRAAPGTAGARYQSFPRMAFSPSGAHLAFEATLTPATGSPLVLPGNERGIWVQTRPPDVQSLLPLEANLLLRLGEPVPTDFGPRRLQSFASLHTGIGSPGQGRCLLQDSPAGPLLYLNGKLQGGGKIIATRTLAGQWNFLAANRTASNNEAIALFTQIGLPALPSDGTRLSFSGAVEVGPGDVLPDEKAGLFSRSVAETFTWETVALAGDFAPGFADQTVFRAFTDPLASPAGLVFRASLAGPGVKSVNARALWVKSGTAAPTLLAREYNEARDANGALWLSFDSLGLLETGDDFARPLFVAKLRPGRFANQFNDTGVWAVTSAGRLSMVLREGQVLDGEPLRGFEILKATTGATRSFNRAAQLVWRATFNGGRTAIYRSDLQ